MVLGLFDSLREGLYVVGIPRKEALTLTEKYHYLKGISTSAKCIGAYHEGTLIAVVVWATPNWESVRSSVLGEEYKHLVTELQRLVLTPNCPYPASQIVSRSIKVLNTERGINGLLPYKVLISFADPSVGHHGGVYQSMSWLYCGTGGCMTGIKRIDPATGHVKTKRIRGVLISNEEALRRGWVIQEVEKISKHRYITFVGTRKEKKRYRKMLKLEVLPYPKPDQDP